MKNVSVPEVQFSFNVVFQYSIFRTLELAPMVKRLDDTNQADDDNHDGTQ